MPYKKAVRSLFKLFPFLTLLLILFMTCSIRLGGYPVLPAVFIIPVFYWIVFRPDLVTLWGLFILGLVYDSLLGYDLGFTSLILMLSSLLCEYIRPYLNPNRFVLIWGAYSLYSFVYIIVYCLLGSGGIPLFVSWIYGVILYPLIAWMLSHLHLRIQKYV